MLVFTGSRPIVWEFAALIACLYVPVVLAYLGTVDKTPPAQVLENGYVRIRTPKRPAPFTESPFSPGRSLRRSKDTSGGFAALRGPTAFGRKNVPCVVRRHQGTYFAKAKGRGSYFRSSPRRFFRLDTTPAKNLHPRTLQWGAGFSLQAARHKYESTAPLPSDWTFYPFWGIR
jgi:hypothetical protein